MTLAEVEQSRLWKLIQQERWIDANQLASSIKEQIRNSDLDYRSRQLINECCTILDKIWGEGRVSKVFSEADIRPVLEDIRQESYVEIGFPSLANRVMEPIRIKTVEQFFQQIGKGIRKPTVIYVGESISLLLQGLLARNTEDIDVVNEVPETIRKQTEVLDQLKSLTGLYMGHFQSHYLPMKWEDRTHYHGEYDELLVSLVDAKDIFISKLFSRRTKDMMDLQVLIKKLNPESILDILNQHCQSLLSVDAFRELAQNNWQLITGEKLPL